MFGAHANTPQPLPHGHKDRLIPRPKAWHLSLLLTCCISLPSAMAADAAVVLKSPDEAGQIKELQTWLSTTVPEFAKDSIATKALARGLQKRLFTEESKTYLWTRFAEYGKDAAAEYQRIGPAIHATTLPDPAKALYQHHFGRILLTEFMSGFDAEPEKEMLAGLGEAVTVIDVPAQGALADVLETSIPGFKNIHAVKQKLMLDHLLHINPWWRIANRYRCTKPPTPADALSWLFPITTNEAVCYEFRWDGPRQLIIPSAASMQKAADARRVDLRNTWLKDCSILKGLVIEDLDLSGTLVSDITALQAISGLKALRLKATAVSDLQALASLPLTHLDLSDTPVRDLTPLAAVPLQEVLLTGSAVTDLSAIGKPALRYLDINRTDITDLTSLQACPLTYLQIDRTRNYKGLDVLEAMTSLTHIGDMPKAACLQRLRTIPELITAQVPAQAISLAAQGYWPHLRGPGNQGKGKAADSALVATLEDATLLWRSRDPLPDSLEQKMPKDNQFHRRYTHPLGGYASPILGDGLVIQYYYVPAGKIIDEAVLEEESRLKGRGRDSAAMLADNVLHAFDATTGARAWRRAFVEDGIRIGSWTKSGGHLTPCLYKGNIYAMGTSGAVYAVDAKTGTPRWRSDIGLRRVHMEYRIKKVLRGKHSAYFNRDMCSAVMVADDTVILNAHQQYKGIGNKRGPRSMGPGAGLVAFDTATGRKRWEKTYFQMLFFSFPAPWNHQGQEFVIAGSGEAGVSLIEPKTGHIRWSISGAGFDNAVTTDADHLYCNGPQGFSCYRISPDQAELRWSLNNRKLKLSGTASPSLVDGKIYASIGKELCVIDCASGKILSKITASGTSSSLASDRGWLIKERGGKCTGPITSSLSWYHIADGRITHVGDRYMPLANSTSPIIDQGLLFVREPEAMACYDLRRK